jgi:CRISPR-associated protein Cmr2
MSFDYWAMQSFVCQYENAQKQAIDYLLHGSGQLPPGATALAFVTDMNARLELLAQAVATNLKEVARAGAPRQPGGLHELYKRQSFQNYLHEQWQQCTDLVALSPNLSLLPAGSFSISFRFTLTSPYLSKDDAALHLLDNPVRKEWVFKLPYIASTQWKGALRAAVRQMNDWDNQDSKLLQLFGEANDNKPDDGKAGRLYFYPTFFDRLGLEVINPHDRKTGAGSQPILMECVPAGTTGAFTLLYTPLDRIGQDEAETRQQLLADLQLLAEGLEALFTLYGFGAKTSSGFGLAELTGTGQFAIHHPDTPAATPQPQEPVYPDTLRAFLENYPSEYLEMKPRQLKEAGVPNQMREQVKEIKELHRTYQRELAGYQESLAEWESATLTPPSPVTERTFSTFAELADVLGSVGGDV